jgi:hypothetical protein
MTLIIMDTNNYDLLFELDFLIKIKVCSVCGEGHHPNETRTWKQFPNFTIEQWLI